MSLRRYLLIIFFLNLIGFGLVSFFLGPSTVNPNWFERGAIGVPLVAGFITIYLSGSARKVNVERRIAFSAYRNSNFLLYGLWIIIVLSCLVVSILHNGPAAFAELREN